MLENHSTIEHQQLNNKYLMTGRVQTLGYVQGYIAAHATISAVKLGPGRMHFGPKL